MKRWALLRRRFAHIPLILNRDGSKMSKRDEGSSIASYIEQGYAPEAVRNYLCLLGWSPKDNREKIEIEEVVQLFELANINRRNAAFDLDKCYWLNGQYVLQMPLGRFRELSEPFVRKAGITVSDEAYFLKVLEIVKEKIKLFRDVPDWIGYFFTENYAFDPEAVAKTLKKPGALDHLRRLRERYEEEEDWSAAGLEVGAETTRNGNRMQNWRTGSSGASCGERPIGGPSLYHMLEVMGKPRVLKRMDRAIREFG